MQMDEMNNTNFSGNPGNYGAPAPQGDKRGMAIASMVLGIVSLVLGWCLWYISLPCAIVGLVLGVLANKAKKNGMATAGIVMSIIGIVLSVIWIILLFGVGITLGGISSLY